MYRGKINQVHMPLIISLYMLQLNFLNYKFEERCATDRLHGLDYVVLWLLHLNAILVSLSRAQNMVESLDP